MRTESMIDQAVPPSTQLEATVHPADLTVQLLAHKWTIPILLELFTGPKRPCDLERKLPGLSAKTLAERLHHLQLNNIIVRKSFAQIPPRVEYSLTDVGIQLKAVLDQLEAYGSYFKLAKTAAPEENQTPNS